MTLVIRALLYSAVMSAACLSAAVGTSAAEPTYVGVLVCAKCHEHHGQSWAKTPHAAALNSLKPAMKIEEKQRAGLDPEKDYSADPGCVGCHTTGFGTVGGYNPAEPDKTLARVGCESGHGAGSVFREEHSEAERKMQAEAEATNRSVLVAAGQNFDFEGACATCHMNYEGSTWSGAKPPYSPFTLAVDPKYAFDFEVAVRGEGIHTHTKLYDIFVGPPIPAFHEEFQSTAVESQ